MAPADASLLRSCVRKGLCLQGDFNHWATLFNYFDDLLERALAVRQDLQLYYDSGGGDIPFPSRSVLAILRVSAIILENCSNKHLYHSYEVRHLSRKIETFGGLFLGEDLLFMRVWTSKAATLADSSDPVFNILFLTDAGVVQHLTSLLAAPDPAVVIATLHTLVAFVRKTHASSVRWHGWPDLNTRLLALSQGWGGKEQVHIHVISLPLSGTFHAVFSCPTLLFTCRGWI